MGVDYYAHTAIGFPVYLPDFIVVADPAALVCRHGHPQRGSDKFCAEDGTPYTTKPEYAMQPLLKTFCQSFNRRMPYESDFSKGEKALKWWWQAFSEENPLFRVQSDDEDEGIIICGVRLGDTGSHRSGARAVSKTKTEISEAFLRVGHYRNTLFGPEPARDIRLYSWLEVG